MKFMLIFVALVLALSFENAKADEPFEFYLSADTLYKDEVFFIELTSKDFISIENPFFKFFQYEPAGISASKFISGSKIEPSHKLRYKLTPLETGELEIEPQRITIGEENFFTPIRFVFVIDSLKPLEPFGLEASEDIERIIDSSYYHFVNSTELEFTAEVQKAVVRLWDNIYIRYSINRNVEEILLPELNDFVVLMQSEGSTQREESAEGNKIIDIEKSLILILKPKRKGAFVISGAKVEIEGQEYYSNELVILVE
jgi:hypothetical protein